MSQADLHRDSSVLRDGLSKAVELDADVQRVCVELYQQLAGGDPVSLENLASALGLSVSEVKQALGTSTLAAVEYDERGRVVGFGGLALNPTPYRFELGGRTLYTWCALDTLFIPRILKKRARVLATCPVSGRRIRLTVGPDRVEECKPHDAFVSLVMPEASQLKGQLRSSFCCHVHFLASQEAADNWLSQNHGAFILPVKEAFEVAQSMTDQRFKDTLPVQTIGVGAGATEPLETEASGCGPSCASDISEEPSPGQRAGLWAAGGSVGSALLASACCWVPLALLAFGASAAGISAAFEKTRPLFLGLAAVLLGTGFYLNYFRKRTSAECSSCAAPRPKLRRFNRATLWVSTVVVLAVALFPHYVASLIARGSPAVAAQTTATAPTTTLRIGGMTCDGCAAFVQLALTKVPGVQGASVSYPQGRALITLDPDSPASNEFLISAVEKLGYQASVAGLLSPLDETTSSTEDSDDEVH
ncbi:MAG: organomercurial lyase MerB [Planctomycetes bacterium]|nr:organomercurial lyase MerB [Planctomycetota bacterium]